MAKPTEPVYRKIYLSPHCKECINNVFCEVSWAGDVPFDDCPECGLQSIEYEFKGFDFLDGFYSNCHNCAAEIITDDDFVDNEDRAYCEACWDKVIEENDT